MSEEIKKPMHWFVKLLCVSLAIATFLTLLPLFFQSAKKRDMMHATSNMRQISVLLYEFENDFGQFPSDETAVVHRDEDGGNIDLTSFKGRFSNDYLGQLIATEYINDEEIFYAKHSSNSKYVDNDISSREKILEAGECGFSYVKGQSSESDSKIPILLSKMTGEGVLFDSKLYKGKAVYVRVDGSAKLALLNKKGEVKLSSGKTLFEGGEDNVLGIEGFDQSLLVHPK